MNHLVILVKLTIILYYHFGLYNVNVKPKLLQRAKKKLSKYGTKELKEINNATTTTKTRNRN